MADSYITIESEKLIIYKEKGSKFITQAFKISTEIEFKQKLDACKKKYYDATHHCYAYIINPNNPTLKLNDDGEPSGTAGKPITGQLQSFNLCNTAIIISRYFGGTKLGTGGLTQAYKQSAKEVLNQCKIITVDLETIVDIKCSYEQLHDNLQKIKRHKGVIISQQINTDCEIRFQISKTNFSALKQHIDIYNIMHITENQPL